LFVNGRTQLGRVTIADVAAEAAGWRLDATTAADVAAEAVDGILAAITDDEMPTNLQTLVHERATAFLGGAG